MQLVTTPFHDFGPTLACEKLAEARGFRIGVETLDDDASATGRAAPRRRACFGELVQVDGSEYAWFGGPALHAAVDDATSQLLALRFVRAGSAFSGQIRLGTIARLELQAAGKYLDGTMINAV